MGTYLIDNVRVLDGTGRSPFAGAALVEGNRITRVTAARAGTAARGRDAHRRPRARRSCPA